MIDVARGLSKKVNVGSSSGKKSAPQSQWLQRALQLTSATMASQGAQKIAILSVYDKTGLLDLAKGLVKENVRLLASGGTAKLIREAGFPVE